MVFVNRKEADCLCIISDVLEHQATGDVYHRTQYLSDGLKCRVVYLHCPWIHTYTHLDVTSLFFVATFTNSLIYQLKKVASFRWGYLLSYFVSRVNFYTLNSLYLLLILFILRGCPLGLLLLSICFFILY